MILMVQIPKFQIKSNVSVARAAQRQIDKRTLQVATNSAFIKHSTHKSYTSPIIISIQFHFNKPIISTIPHNLQQPNKDADLLTNEIEWPLRFSHNLCCSLILYFFCIHGMFICIAQMLLSNISLANTYCL